MDACGIVAGTIYGARFRVTHDGGSHHLTPKAIEDDLARRQPEVKLLSSQIKDFREDQFESIFLGFIKLV